MDHKQYNRFTSALSAHPGIMGRNEMFHSVVLVPFVYLDGEYHLLFEKRAPNIAQGGEICFPGGAFEEEIDTAAEDTAVRETCEELGLTPDRVLLDGRLDSLVASMGALIDICVGRLEISGIPEITPQPTEVDEVFTVPFSYFRETEPETYHVHLEIKPSYYNQEGEEVVLLPAQELGLPPRYHRPWGSRHSKVYVYKETPHVIWGITARIIREVVMRAEGC